MTSPKFTIDGYVRPKKFPDRAGGLAAIKSRKTVNTASAERAAYFI
jgi:hypothetical protein